MAADLRFGLADAAFDEAFEVDRTFGISVKAMVQRMIQVLQAEMPGTPLIRTVEERTMVWASAHTTGGVAGSAGAASGLHRQGGGRSVNSVSGVG